MAVITKNKAGFDECVSVTRLTMNVIGLWPLDEKKNLFTLWRFLTSASLILFFIVIPQTQKVMLIQNDFNLMLEVLTTADIIEGICLLKLFGIWYNKADLKKVVLQVARDWNNASRDDQRIMWTNAHLSKLVAFICISSSSGSVFTHASVFLVTNMGLNANKSLFLKAQFPFNTQYSPMFEIICICQFVGAFLSCFAFSSFDGFFVFSILHFSSQIYNLRKRIQNLTKEENDKKYDFAAKLKSVVNHHQHLISYTDIIEHNFNKIFLIQIFATSVVLCLQGYQFVMIISENGTKLLTNLIFILVFTTGNVLSLFMYCYIAEIIRNESLRLFFAVYEMDWYTLPARDSCLLLIVMCRLRTPVEITVGKFAPFSLNYFTNVVKTSVGYLSMLLAIKNKVD